MFVQHNFKVIVLHKTGAGVIIFGCVKTLYHQMKTVPSGTVVVINFVFGTFLEFKIWAGILSHHWLFLIISLIYL